MEYCLYGLKNIVFVDLRVLFWLNLFFFLEFIDIERDDLDYIIDCFLGMVDFLDFLRNRFKLSEIMNVWDRIGLRLKVYW